MKTAPTDGCLPRPLGINDQGEVTAMGVIAFEATAGTCDCSRLGRAPAARDEVAAVRQELEAQAVCGGSRVACSAYCGCRILELAGPSSDPTSPLYACQNQTTVSDASFVGFCFIEPGHVDENGMPAPLGNPELVAACAPTQPQRLRFLGADTPLPGANVFLLFASLPPPP